MKKMIAIVAFIAVAFVSASALAQEPVGPRNLSGAMAPEGGFNVTRFGSELQQGWVILLVSPVQTSHDVAIVDDAGNLVLINDGSIIPIDPSARYLVAAADSTVTIIQP